MKKRLVSVAQIFLCVTIFFHAVLQLCQNIDVKQLKTGLYVVCRTNCGFTALGKTQLIRGDLKKDTHLDFNS